MPACVEPEIHHWAESSTFYDVLDDVGPIKDKYPESRILHSHPVAAANADRNLNRRALRDAILHRLENCPNRPKNLRIFSSFPVEHEGFLIVTLLGIQDNALDSVPSVVGDKIQIHSHRSFHVPCNLVESTIEVILEDANEQIVQPDAGASLSVLGSADDILRRAGIRLFSGLLNRVDTESEYVGRASSTYDTLSRLSLTYYESAEPKGSLVIAEKDDDCGTQIITLADPVPISQIRALRKLLVLANNGLALRCNCVEVFSLISRVVSDKSKSCRACEISITGRGAWMVSMDGCDLMSISDGHPTLPTPLVNKDDLAADLCRHFPDMTSECAGRFAQIGRSIAESGHGALLVISDNAEQESVRLDRDGLRIQPIALSPDLSPQLSEIDGAVLCSVDGLCHAIGVILDGSAVTTGDRGRGSRFNSANRYVSNCSNRCVAMVVSEDGGLDLIPQLKPSLSRIELANRLKQLEYIAHNAPKPPNREYEAEIIEWVENHAYYLNAEQCANANIWIAECDDRYAQDPEVMVQIIRRKIKVDPAFNPERDLS